MAAAHLPCVYLTLQVHLRMLPGIVSHGMPIHMLAVWQLHGSGPVRACRGFYRLHKLECLHGSPIHQQSAGGLCGHNEGTLHTHAIDSTAGGMARNCSHRYRIQDPMRSVCSRASVQVLTISLRIYTGSTGLQHAAQRHNRRHSRGLRTRLIAVALFYHRCK